MESPLLWKRLSWPMQVVVWLFAFYAAWNLVMAGYGKILEPQAMFGFPEWLMRVVGIVELVGPLLMFVPAVAFYGALPTAVVMAVASYVVNFGQETFDLMGTIQHPATVLFVVCAIVAVLTRPAFLRKKAKITKISV